MRNTAYTYKYNLNVCELLKQWEATGAHGVAAAGAAGLGLGLAAGAAEPVVSGPVGGAGDAAGGVGGLDAAGVVMPDAAPVPDGQGIQVQAGGQQAAQQLHGGAAQLANPAA